MLTAQSSAWFHRIYLWWYRHKYGPHQTPTTSNLCPYMRVLFLWAPLRAIFWDWVRIGWFPINVVTIPTLWIAVANLLGYVSYTAKLVMYVMFVCGVLAGLGIGLIILSFAVVDNTDQARANFIARMGQKWDSFAHKTKLDQFGQLIKAWYRAAHDQICPQITFVDDQGNPIQPPPPPPSYPHFDDYN